MSRRLLIKTCILLAVTTHARAQYIDFIQNFNSFLQPFTTSKPKNDATKRPDAKHRQTNKLKYQDVIFFDTDDVAREKPKTVDPFAFYTTTAKPKRKNAKTTTSQNRTTQTPELNNHKPVNSNRIVNNNRNVNHEAIIKSDDNRENDADDRMINNARRIDNYGFENIFNSGTANKPTNFYGLDNNYNRQTTRRTTTDYYNNVRQTTRKTTEYTTRKPNVYYNGRETTKNYKNDRTTRWETFTTLNPLLNRPGVRPAIVDDSRPPITNRPLTSRPSNVRPFDTGSYRPVNTRPYETERPVVHRPVSSGVIRPVTGVNSPPTSGVNRPETSDDETGVAIEIGPDEDEMSESEKRRLYDLCEQKCDEYKSARVKKVVALPLAPNSQGVVLNVSTCAPTNIPLIIGGAVVKIEQFPHMALVGWKNLQKGGYSWKCGGSLVSAQFVVTAGHCTFQDRDNNVLRYAGDGPPQVVQLGSSLHNDRSATLIQISTIIRHPKYKLRRSYFDVALIKLATSVTFSDKISPACLGVPPAVGEPVIATGWGKTEFGGDSSIELRSVSINIWDMTECREIWGTSLKLPNGPKPSSQVCAGDRAGGKDTCLGDSGGPAQVQDGCLWRVVAVTSVGRSCGAPDTPALYAKIPRAFIASQIYTNVKSGRDNNNQYGNNGFNRNNWNTGNNNGQNGNNNGQIGNNNGQNGNNNGGFGNGMNNNDPLGNRGVANIRPVQNNNGQNYDNSGRGQGNNGHSYDNSGRGQSNNGQSYDNSGRGQNNNGQSYDNSGRGQNNGQYYSGSQGTGNVNSNNWNNNANIFGNNQNTRDNNNWSVRTDTSQNNKNVYEQSGYGNEQNYRTTTTVGYQNYGQNGYNANSYGQNGYNNEQSPTDGYMTQNVFNNGNANNNGYNNNYPVVNRPWWTK